MFHVATVVIAAAVVLQLASAVMALRLVSVTRHRRPWFAVAAAVTLMALRRLQSLLPLVAGTARAEPDLLFELNGLLISVLMVYGMSRIRPLFVTLARAESEQRAMAARLGTLSTEQAKLIDDLQDALARVRTLRGMIPICAVCKNIRDDKGYWSQVEAYVHEHSEAEFSHAICPSCFRKLYPDLADEVLEAQGK